MCVGMPARILEVLDAENGIAQADVGGVRRKVNVALLHGSDAVGAGDWVVVHMGFAMAKIDEEEARDLRGFLDDPQPADDDL